MVLKVTFQKESPKQSFPKVTSEAKQPYAETSTKVFSCENCEILASSFFFDYFCLFDKVTVH